MARTMTKSRHHITNVINKHSAFHFKGNFNIFHILSCLEPAIISVSKTNH